MTHLIQLDESIEVQRPLHEVFAYVSEFSRIEEWDPAVARGVRLTDGALGVGSQFRVDMKAGFSLLYTVVEWVPVRRLLMTVDSKPFRRGKKSSSGKLPKAHESGMSPPSTSLRHWPVWRRRSRE